MRTRHVLQLSALSMMCALVAACGGGATSSSPAPATVTSSTLQSFAFAQGGTVALPSAANISSSVTFPGAPGSQVASFTASVSSQAPSGTPALSVSRALPAGLRSVQDIGTGNGVEFITITTPQVVALPSGPSFVFTLPSVVATDTYYLAALSGSQWVLTYEGPGTVSGTTVSFAANPNPIGLSSQIFALLAVPTAGLPTPTPSPNASPTSTPSASPTVTPTPSPSPSPSPTPLPIALSPASIVVTNISNPTNASPPSSAQPTFTATVPGSPGSFIASLSCANTVATLASGLITVPGGSATFTVNVVGAGTCDLSITAGTASEVIPSFVTITGH